MKGIVDMEIGGKVRHFHFGTYWSMLCEEQGISISDDDSMSEAPVGKLISAIHNAALAYCELNKTEPDFRKVEVASWIDEVGLEKFMKVIVKALTGSEEKNRKALETQGT